MSKTLFHTITVKVPADMIYHNKRTGGIQIVPTLTKTGGLTKRAGESSIILKKDDYLIHPAVENGETGDYEEMKNQHTKLKQIKKRLEKLPPKKKDYKEGFKYALSQLPKKQQKSFLGDWLEIKKSGKNDKNVTKLQSVIYDLMFDIIDSKYSKEDINSFIDSLRIPDSVFENIKNWVDKKNNMGQGIEYSDFVKKVIYPILLKSVPKDTDKIKLMMYANDIANDPSFNKELLNQKNKSRITRTFTDHKIPAILNKLKADSNFDKLYKDLQMTSFTNDRNTLWQAPNYKPLYNYENIN